MIRDRQETEELKQRVKELEETLRARDIKSQHQVDRMKRKINELTQSNRDLNEEIRILEQERLQKSSAQINASRPTLVIKPNVQERPTQAVRDSSSSSKKPTGNTKLAGNSKEKVHTGKNKDEGTSGSGEKRPNVEDSEDHPTGTQVIEYPNGSVKKIRPDGHGNHECEV
jgi:hypothetical protein